MSNRSINTIMRRPAFGVPLASFALCFALFAPANAQSFQPVCKPTSQLAAPTGHLKTAEELREALTKVDQIFTKLYAQEGVGGFTVGVISGPDLIWTKSYGLADMENKKPATKDTVYRIGSITKEFTATMLCQLVSQGKVRLSDPVAKYFPEIKNVPTAYPDAPPITLVQLASHTSGLDSEPDPIASYTTGAVSEWEHTLIAALPHLRYVYEPGTHYRYSNIGFAILGAALSRAAGQPYTRYVPDRILAPLHMAHSGLEPNAAIVEELAKGYGLVGKPDPSEAANELKNGRGYKVPNGALFTTVEDLARFVSFQMGYAPDETVLPKSVVSAFFSRLYSASADLKAGYGLGFSAQRIGNSVALGHAGGVAGYTTHAIFDPKSHLGLVMLHNVFDEKASLDYLEHDFTALETLTH